MVESGLWLLAAFELLMVLCLAVRVLTAGLVGVRPTVCSLNVGPLLFAFRARGVRWELRAIPLGVFMGFPSGQDQQQQQKEQQQFARPWARSQRETPSNVESPTDHDPQTDPALWFENQPRGKRLAIIASQPLALIAVAAVCLGWQAGAECIAHGFPQIFAPFVGDQPASGLIAAMFAFAGEQPFLVLLGAAAAKATAANLLPLGILDGGLLLLHLPRRPIEAAFYVYVSLMVLLALIIGWLYEIGKYIAIHS